MIWPFIGKMGINKRRTKNKILFSQYFSVFWGKKSYFFLFQNMLLIYIIIAKEYILIQNVLRMLRIAEYFIFVLLKIHLFFNFSFHLRTWIQNKFSQCTLQFMRIYNILASQQLKRNYFYWKTIWFQINSSEHEILSHNTNLQG